MKYRIFITSFTIFSILAIPVVSFAATIESVNQQISDTNTQIQALDKEIKKYQDQISLTSEQAQTLANLIKELTLTRSKLLKETQLTEKKITATNLMIGSLTENISMEQKSINDSKRLLAVMLRNLNERDNTGVLYQLMSQTSFSDASQEYNNIISLNKEVKNNIADLKNKVDALNLSKTKKQTEQKTLVVLKTDLANKKLAVDITKKEKDTLLAETKNKEANYKKLLAEREKMRETFERELKNYEAQLQFILNPKLLPKAGSEVLSWPLDKIVITSHFTERWGRFHYGTDFRASIGTAVKAMATGEVLGSGDTDVACKGASFGKWVFIKYDNGLSSTYGHLSSITARIGQRVSAGDVVALSGNTGSSTGPHLHVSVYASEGVKVETVPSKSCNGKIFTQPIAALTAYLNPVLYLPK